MVTFVFFLIPLTLIFWCGRTFQVILEQRKEGTINPHLPICYAFCFACFIVYGLFLVIYFRQDEIVGVLNRYIFFIQTFRSKWVFYFIET